MIIVTHVSGRRDHPCSVKEVTLVNIGDEKHLKSTVLQFDYDGLYTETHSLHQEGKYQRYEIRSDKNKGRGDRVAVNVFWIGPCATRVRHILLPTDVRTQLALSALSPLIHRQIPNLPNCLALLWNSNRASLTACSTLISLFERCLTTAFAS